VLAGGGCACTYHNSRGQQKNNNVRGVAAAAAYSTPWANPAQQQQQHSFQVHCPAKAVLLSHMKRGCIQCWLLASTARCSSVLNHVALCLAVPVCWDSRLLPAPRLTLAAVPMMVRPGRPAGSWQHDSVSSSTRGWQQWQQPGQCRIGMSHSMQSHPGATAAAATRCPHIPTPAAAAGAPRKCMSSCRCLCGVFWVAERVGRGLPAGCAGTGAAL
jgi:hypothetical protein